MNETGNNIVQQLFGEASLTEVSPKAIEQIVSRYPYFGPAQFLLAKKLKDTNAYRNEAQLQKAALYFSNPYWLNYLLNEASIAKEDAIILTENNGEAPAEAAATEIELTLEEITEEPVALSTEIEEQPEEIIEDIEVNETSIDTPPVENIELSQQSIPEHITEVPVALSAETEHLPGEITGNDGVTEAPVFTEYRATNDLIIEDAADTLAKETTDHEITEDIIEEEEEYLPTAEENESDPQRLKLSSLIEQHLANFKKPVEAGEELPVKTNPFHTVDYFASQGIKADGTDKLTHRVKKFTDWLKQMKAPNAQPTDLGTDAETEQMIETIAQTSNETKDIVTEAMAQVLVKQGKTEKAAQLYKKLSFLNPAKSTYFAAKIDELNNK